MRPSVSSLILLAVVPVASSCWTTKEDGAALRRDVDRLKHQLSKDIEQSTAERQKLKKIMEQATALLTRNSADVGAQVDRIQAQNDRNTGQIEQNQKLLQDLSQQLTEFKAKVDVKLEGLSNTSGQGQNPPVPQDKSELFNLASSTLSGGNHKEARGLLRHFISRFPNDARVDKAQLMLGDSYYAEQKFAPAIVEYKKVIEQHKRSTVIPDALYKIGMSFYQLKFCADAELFLRQLLKRHKRHAQAHRAKKVLNLIRRYKRNKNVCRP